MKLEPHIILKWFINFSDFEPQYSYEFLSYKKGDVLNFLFMNCKALTNHGSSNSYESFYHLIA